MARHWIQGRKLAFEGFIAQRKKDSVAAAMTKPCMGCSEEDSVCLDGRAVGRRHFSFLEEVMSELASEWTSRMGWHSGQGLSRYKGMNTPPRGPAGERNRSQLVEGLEWWVKELGLYSEGSWDRNSIRLGLGLETAVDKAIKCGSSGDP